MSSTDVISFGYALVVFSGGLIGYLKAGSLMSLVSGVAFGGLLAYGATRTSANPKDCLFLLVVSGVLMGLMGFRFYKSHKIMPAGVVSVLSLFQVIRLAIRFT